MFRKKLKKIERRKDQRKKNTRDYPRRKRRKD